MPAADRPDRIEAEVAVAWPELQVVIPVELPAGATIADAIECSGIRRRFPALEIDPGRLGVFASLRKPDDPVRNGDRVEIYRPLRIDPKLARRLAAEARTRSE
ncbi:MAG: RnfH family protein [Wenzhouxiangellaceae bacterium]|jgi:putative ubiquitin-RnfH superfamily antitoxin RatB of RatAB toxin-antitoxin module|nr:RnfH family protein [Wenzhouxiangellaceae bacterium]MBS3747196.1 RnfH family protein [Wenzhouxiangellaceae bacterium]MBS3823374.1 RnfH family protein [Wenzhouxiangellaceae bacterium]